MIHPDSVKMWEAEGAAYRARIATMGNEIEKLNREALDAHYIMTAQQREIERLQRWQRGARGWLAACLGYVTGNGPPNWDGIRAFLANGEQSKGENDVNR